MTSIIHWKHMCNVYIRSALFIVLVLLIPAWAQPEPNIKESKMHIKIYIGEPITKIEGTKWPVNSDGTIPLAYNIATPSEFELSFGSNSITSKGSNSYITATQQHIVKSASIENIFNAPLPFDEAKQTTLNLLSNLNIHDPSIKESVEEWEPIDIPSDNDSKLKLRINKRWAAPVPHSVIDKKFKFKLILQEESENLWQLGISFEVIDSKI